MDVPFANIYAKVENYPRYYRHRKRIFEKNAFKVFDRVIYRVRALTLKEF